MGEAIYIVQDGENYGPHERRLALKAKRKKPPRSRKVTPDGGIEVTGKDGRLIDPKDDSFIGIFPGAHFGRYLEPLHPRSEKLKDYDDDDRPLAMIVIPALFRSENETKDVQTVKKG